MATSGLRRRIHPWALLTAGLAVAVGAPQAVASQATVLGQTVFYAAGTGEVNDVIVTVSGDVVRIEEATVTPTGTASCPVVGGAIECVVPGVVGVSVELGDLDDRAVAGTGTPSVRFEGGSGDDELTGGAGADVLEGGAGADTLTGGAGLDMVDYTMSAAGVTVEIGGAGTGGEAEGDVIAADVQGVYGSPFDDQMTGTGGDESFFTAAGADVIDAGGGDDTIEAGDGPDQITGGPGEDALSYVPSPTGVQLDLEIGMGHGGHAEGDLVSGDVEVLFGSFHDDTFSGTDDPDGFYAGVGDDHLEGRGGNDAFFADEGDDTVAAGDGEDAVQGGPGADMLDGAGGADHIQPGPGADMVVGGDDTDIVSYTESAAGIRITIGTGSGAGGDAEGDTLSADLEYLVATPFDDVVHGGVGDEVIEGRGGADLLTGSLGADTVLGGEGDDVVSGGAGADVMSGGDGIDIASYANRSEPVAADLDGDADDGEVGEDDSIEEDVEGIQGGSGDDVLSAVSAGTAGILRGGPGDDSLDVADDAGGDSVDGGDGFDSASVDTGDEWTAVEAGVPVTEPAPPASREPVPPAPAPAPAAGTGPDTVAPTLALARLSVPRRGPASRRPAGRRVRLTAADDRAGALAIELRITRGRCARLTAAGRVVVAPRRRGRCAPAAAVRLAATRPVTITVPPVGVRLEARAVDAAGNRSAPVLIDAGPGARG